jgi:hypothetical protein
MCWPSACHQGSAVKVQIQGIKDQQICYTDIKFHAKPVANSSVTWLLNNASSAAEAVYLTLQDDYKL